MKRLRPRAGKRINSTNYMKVNSETILAVDYSPAEKLLEVKQSPGAVYHFIDVPESYWTRIKILADRQPSKLHGFIKKELESKFYYFLLKDQAENLEGQKLTPTMRK